MRILALDLATSTGYAVGDTGQSRPRTYGRQQLAGATLGEKLTRCGYWLRGLLRTEHPVDFVMVERPHLRGAGSYLLVGLAATAAVAAYETGVPHGCWTVHTGTLKKHAAGGGRATKDQMIKAANQRWDVSVQDDDEADALCLLGFALDKLATPYLSDGRGNFPVVKGVKRA